MFSGKILTELHTAGGAYSRGGQLVFDWDRLENFLLTRDRPVGKEVTGTKCQSWVSHVQIQCTIALVSDAQIEGTASSNHDCPAITGKHITNTFAASALLAYGQPSQKAPKVHVTNQLMDNLYVLSGILIEKCSLYSRYLYQFNAKSGAIDKLTLGDQLVDHPWHTGINSLL